MAKLCLQTLWKPQTGMGKGTGGALLAGGSYGVMHTQACVCPVSRALQSRQMNGGHKQCWPHDAAALTQALWEGVLAF